MPLQNTDILLVNRAGTSHQYSFQNFVNDLDATGSAEATIPNGTAWTVNQPFWNFAGGTINFPTVPAASVNMSGLIRLTANVIAWNGDGFQFPDGADIPGTAKALLPFYVESQTVILIGRETPSYS